MVGGVGKLSPPRSSHVSLRGQRGLCCAFLGVGSNRLSDQTGISGCIQFHFPLHFPVFLAITFVVRGGVFFSKCICRAPRGFRNFCREAVSHFSVSRNQLGDLEFRSWWVLGQINSLSQYPCVFRQSVVMHVHTKHESLMIHYPCTPCGPRASAVRIYQCT